MDIYQLVSANKLGVNLEELARNILLIKEKNESEKQEILKRADRELPIDVSLEGQKLLINLNYHRPFLTHCEELGLNFDYNTIQTQHSRLIKIALADYFLKTK